MRVFLFFSANSQKHLLSFYQTEMCSFCLSTNNTVSFTFCVYCADFLFVLEVNCGNKANNDKNENNLIFDANYYWYKTYLTSRDIDLPTLLAI